MYVKAIKILRRNENGSITWHPALHLGGFKKDKDGNTKADFLLTEEGISVETSHYKKAQNYVEDSHYDYDYESAVLRLREKL